MFPNLGIEAWGLTYRYGYYALLASLLVGFIATAATFLAGNRISADLTLRLSRTTETAGEAVERAAKLEAQARALEVEAAQVKLEAAQAGERAAKLEAEISPRDIGSPPDALQALASQQGRLVKVSSYVADAEGLRLALQIMRGLSKLNFAVEDDTLTHQVVKPMAFGVQVSGPDETLVGALSKWLEQLLQPAPPPSGPFSTTIQFGVVTSAQSPSATIFVGSKPIPESR